MIYFDEDQGHFTILKVVQYTKSLDLFSNPSILFSSLSGDELQFTVHANPVHYTT